MRTRTLLSALVAVWLLQTGILAQDKQEMPRPAPELSQIAYFEGHWTCQGTMKDSPMGPGGAFETTVDIKRDLGGFWQSGQITGTMKNMPPFEVRFHATYDPAGKQFVMLGVDSMGGWAQNTSSGWKGETIVYEGESRMGSKKMRVRDTFTRSGADAMTHTWEGQIDGKWTDLGEETCRKK